MVRIYSKGIIPILVFIFLGCKKPLKLHPVTVKEFREFVTKTDYVTDAEKFGWSFVQKDIFDFEVKEGVTWKNPNGNNKAEDNLPVTQVSYNDAKAYCEWADVVLPEYGQYWEAVKYDQRKINMNSDGINPVVDVNIVGNVWDITITENKRREIRLAGGSYLCSEDSCNGTDPERKLFVDKTTGNTNIGFSVLK